VGKVRIAAVKKVSRELVARYPDKFSKNYSYTYDSNNNRLSVTDKNGKTSLYSYDAMGRLTLTTFPDGTTEGATYNAEGHRLTLVNGAGQTTSYEYDKRGHVLRTTFPDGSFTTTTYDAAGHAIQTTDERANVTRFVYDAAGRRTQLIDSLNNTTTFVYDAAGNQLSMTDASGNTVQYQYDAGNRRTRVNYQDGTFDATAYDALGHSISKTDQAGRTTQFQYDALGRLIRVTDAFGQATNYGYDALGNRISQTDAAGRITRFEYDRFGRLTSRTLPVGMVGTLLYDAAGNQIAKTDFNGKTTTYTYDPMNRLLAKTPDPSLGEPAVSFTYTSTGQRMRMNDASGLTTYQYDSRDRLTQKATLQGTLSYTYDLHGNLASIRSSNTNGTSVNYSYDALNRLATVRDDRLSPGTTTYTYDSVGNVASFLYPNGVQHGYAYNGLNRLTNVGVTGPATAASYAYTLGSVGNRTAVTESGGRLVSYAYDALYRLTSETIAGSANPDLNGAIGYTYDTAGNRLARSSTIATVPPQASSYDADDRLTADIYDNNGNTVVSGGNMFAYDFENRLRTKNGGAVTIVYDGDGNRVARTEGTSTTRYLVDDRNLTGHSQVLEELSGAAVQRVYTYGLTAISQTQAAGTSFYGFDGHGNVRFLIDPSGAITDRYDYDSFGNFLQIAGNTPNTLFFAGEQLDSALGVYYMRARYYGAATGRFLTADLLGGNSFDPSSLHRYLYGRNDPVNRIDPDGTQFDLGSALVSVAIQATISAAISGAITYYATGNIKKALAAAVGGFIIGAVVGGVFQGARYLLLARGAAALGEAAGDVLITSDKLRYLTVLDPGKANGFRLLGYTAENTDKLADVLAASRGLITETTAKTVTEFGTKYEVAMQVLGANGREGIIEVIWQVDHGSTVFRLITAIPKPF